MARILPAVPGVVTAAKRQKLPAKGRKGPAKARKGPAKARSPRYPEMEAWCEAVGLPRPEREIKFWPGRRFALDFGFRYDKQPGGVALEIEGGAWARKGARKCPVCKQTPHGRHSGSGFVQDALKYSEAAARGWRIIRVTPKDRCSFQTADLLRRALAL